MPDEPRSPQPDPQNQKEKRAGSERGAWQQVGRYGELGFLLPACTFVGWAMGAGLDRWLGTHWLTLTGVVVGIVAGFVQMVRVAMRAAEKL
jgi:F0F1-type ATP synthase assembly protein I